MRQGRMRCKPQRSWPGGGLRESWLQTSVERRFGTGKFKMLSRFLAQHKLRSALNWLGLAILLAGLVSAALIWRTSKPDSANPDQERIDPSTPLAPSDSRKQTRQIEIYYGKTGVLAERWREEIERFKSGRALAKLVVVVSLIAAFGCFLLASRQPMWPSNDPTRFGS